MKPIKNVPILVVMIVSVVAFAASDTPKAKSSGGRVLVLFTDTTVYRRTLDSAPKIGSGEEDYRVDIGCTGTDDCIGKISKIYNLITKNRKYVKSCKTPIYARVELKPDMVGYGESEKNVIEEYDIDYTGTCVTHRGRSYKTKESIFELLNTLPVPMWSGIIETPTPKQ